MTAGTSKINASDYNKLSSNMGAGTKIVKQHATNMTGGNWTVSLP